VVSPRADVSRGRWISYQSQDAGGDLGQGLDKAVDLLGRGEWSGTPCAHGAKYSKRNYTGARLQAEATGRRNFRRAG